MDIHQMQLVYDPRADRLLWRVRTRAGELFGIWLTRRLALRFWPPFQSLVSQAGVQTLAPQATLTPEAREMLAQTARQRPLPSADFKAPFELQAVSQPLGPEPLLPEQIDLVPAPAVRGLRIRIREAGGRALELQLNDDLATALLRLLDQALAASEWLAVPPSQPASATGTAAAPPPAALN